MKGPSVEAKNCRSYESKPVGYLDMGSQRSLVDVCNAFQIFIDFNA